MRRVVEARARGPGWGVLVALPDELGAETPEEAAALEAAGARGYFVGVVAAETLLQFVPVSGHDPAMLARIRRQLRHPPPDGQVHVLATLDGCVATLTPQANAEMVAARDRDEARLKRIAELLALAEPVVLRRAAEQGGRPRSVFVVTAPDHAALQRLRGVASADLETAHVEGVYVGLHDAADAIAALPFEDLEAQDALQTAQRLMEAIPAGSVRVVAVYDGQMTTVTRPAVQGCLTVRPARG